MVTKQISFGEFDKQDSNYLAELVQELLNNEHIYTESFAFSIEVEYMEREPQERTQ